MLYPIELRAHHGKYTTLFFLKMQGIFYFFSKIVDDGLFSPGGGTELLALILPCHLRAVYFFCHLRAFFILSSSGLTRRSREYKDFFYPGFPFSWE